MSCTGKGCPPIADLELLRNGSGDAIQIKVDIDFKDGGNSINRKISWSFFLDDQLIFTTENGYYLDTVLWTSNSTYQCLNFARGRDSINFYLQSRFPNYNEDDFENLKVTATVTNSNCKSTTTLLENIYTPVNQFQRVIETSQFLELCDDVFLELCDGQFLELC